MISKTEGTKTMFDFSKRFFNFKKMLALIFSIVLLFVNDGGMTLWTDGASILSSAGAKNHLLSVYSHCFYDSTVKLSSLAPIGKTADYKMYMAKNESEFCQIAIRSTKGRRESYIKVSDFTDKNGNVIPVELYYEYQVELTGQTDFEYMPDPLVPMDHECNFFSLKETNNVFAIVAKTDKNAVPGDYTATVEYGNSDSQGNKYELSSAKISLHVWDFELPTTPALETAFGNWSDWLNIGGMFNAEGEELQQLKDYYYELLLSHRISPYNIPYSINDERAEKYLNDERMTSFCIGEGDYSKVQLNPDWAKKAYFYPIDEPSSQEAIDSYIRTTDYLKDVCPGYNMVTPMSCDKTNAVDRETGEPIYNIDIQNGRSNIMCVLTTVLVDEPGSLEKVLARQAKGDRFWTYVCCIPEPTENMCDFYIQQQGLNHRILFWQNYDIGSEGLLYWCASYWYGMENNDVPKIWVRAHEWDAWSKTFGDGYLTYPAVKGMKTPNKFYAEYSFDKNEIFSSLRLESIMNGVEDYDYLKLAENLIGKDKTDKILHKVTTSLTEFTYSDSVFRNARIELGNAIEQASNKVMAAV